MTTTLNNCRIEISKQMGDYWAGTTTSAGDSTSVIDTALKAKQNAWITDETYDFITSATCLSEERKVVSLDNSSGDMTVLAHTGTGPGSGGTYEVHRLFTPSDKRIALIYAARMGFPYIHDKIWDESMVSGNWLKDGSFEIWTSATALTHWAKNGSATLAQTSTSPYYKHGSYSCGISGAADYIYQDIAKWDDLKRLAGKSVTFTAQVHCDTASCARLGVLYDGTNVSYSSYHPGGTDWTTNEAPLSVTVQIDDTPTDIEFRVYHDNAAGTTYVDDARVIASTSDKPRLYIGDIGLAQEYPYGVYREPDNYSMNEPWQRIHGCEIDTEGGYLYLPHWVPNDYRLRIKGIAYLDFLASGVSSTAWTATINIDAPQTDILYAEAMVYLCNQMIVPNYTVGTSDKWKEALQFWQAELRARRGKHSMPMPTIPVKWR